MASFFGHAMFALGIGFAFKKRLPAIIGLGVLCTLIPDADVIGYYLGVPYGSFWGHRGFTHSIVFALLFSVSLSLLFARKEETKKIVLAYWLYFFACTMSHPLLDAMTTGGKGVAFFAPFDNGRYFLPWRPIQVSPMGLSKFFSEWGLRVIKSELFWIGIPSFTVGLLFYLKRKFK